MKNIYKSSSYKIYKNKNKIIICLNNEIIQNLKICIIIVIYKYKNNCSNYHSVTYVRSHRVQGLHFIRLLMLKLCNPNAWKFDIEFEYINLTFRHRATIKVKHRICGVRASVLH